MPDEPLNYATAGVDIEAAQRSLRSVMPAIASSQGPEVLAGVGGFGGLFDATSFGIPDPVLVSSIDGVGTKTKVAAMVGNHSFLGHDIVNHCVNDILCQGARPLFFLDYFGCSHLEEQVFADVVVGAAEACREVGCALIGGETAEMPGVYHDGEVDLVGTIVGVASRSNLFPKVSVEPGDKVIGIAGSGLHTNGYSLARRALFELGGLSVRDEVPGVGSSIGDELLRPHRCYYHAVYPLLMEDIGVQAVAHITGGGMYDNIPRVLPNDCRITIDRRSWTPLPIFEMIQQCGNIAWPEMYRAFNMGIGMVLVVKNEVVSAVVQRLAQAGEMASLIGEVERGPRDVQIV